MELDLRLRGSLADSVLEDRAHEILGAVERHAPDIALGPALAINFHECAVKLQFDVVAATSAELHRKLGELLTIIERETNFPIDSVNTTADFAEVSGEPS